MNRLIRWMLTLLATAYLLPLYAQQEPLRVGSEHLEQLLPLLKDKRVALIINQTSRVDSTLLPDTLRALGIDIKAIMIPEHGFRGTGDAGQKISNGVDTGTGIPIISLYGNNKKPTNAQLQNIDVMVFDLQDVGARFYTYISTMHYAMEAAAENDKAFVVCDRPNPKDYVDGPVLENDCRSFIGMHRIPILHGLTVGELAMMINGERWLKNKNRCKLEVIKVTGWKHGDPYVLPVPPSPNLRSKEAIAWYPTLCFFEASIMSVGRGTDFPFTVLGYPNQNFGDFYFVPKPKTGASQPMHQGKRCYGYDLRPNEAPNGISLEPLIFFYNKCKEEKLSLINRKRTFELIAGNKKLLKQLAEGLSETQIRLTWEPALSEYKELRKKYLLYP